MKHETKAYIIIALIFIFPFIIFGSVYYYHFYFIPRNPSLKGLGTAMIGSARIIIPCLIGIVHGLKVIVADARAQDQFEYESRRYSND